MIIFGYMLDKIVEKGKIFLTVTWTAAGSVWMITNHILAIIATIAAILASILAARYYHNENKRREKKIRMDKELHEKKMNGGGR